MYALHGEENSQRAISLPSSPDAYRSRNLESRGSEHTPGEEMVSTWNKILETRMFHDKLLLPYEEWNIDFAELTVGTRVGIGKPFHIPAICNACVSYIKCSLHELLMLLSSLRRNDNYLVWTLFVVSLF